MGRTISPAILRASATRNPPTTYPLTVTRPVTTLTFTPSFTHPSISFQNLSGSTPPLTRRSSVPDLASVNVGYGVKRAPSISPNRLNLLTQEKRDFQEGHLRFSPTLAKRRNKSLNISSDHPIPPSIDMIDQVSPNASPSSILTQSASNPSVPSPPAPPTPSQGPAQGTSTATHSSPRPGPERHTEPSPQNSSQSNFLPAVNLYDSSHPGPYQVSIGPFSKGSSSLHPEAASELFVNILASSNIDCGDAVLSSKRSGSRYTLTLSSLEAANTLLSSPAFAAHGLNCYLPIFSVTRAGILRNISKDKSIEWLRSHIKSPAPVLEMRRLRTLSSSGNTASQYSDTESIYILFKGHILPEQVTFNFLWHEKVFPYVNPVKLCNRCLRIGHLDKFCRSKQRCLHCLSLDHTDHTRCPNSNAPPSCLNCRRNHRSNDALCPAFIREKEIHKLAAEHGCSYNEIREGSYQRAPSQSSSLRYTPDNFPSLPRSSPWKTPINFTSSTPNPSLFPPLHSASPAPSADFSTATPIFDLHNILITNSTSSVRLTLQ